MFECKNKIVAIIYIMLGIGIGIVLGLFIIHKYIGWDIETTNSIKVIAYFFIGCSALVATGQLIINANQAKKNTNQIKYSNDWNKKQLAIQRIHESKSIIKKSTTYLHQTLRPRGREASDPYEVYEIHNYFGCFLEDGKFVFHGEETQEDIQKLPKTWDADDLHKYKFDKELNGREVQDNIWIFLDEFEYICAGINNKIFDKETITSLMGSSIMNTYKKFKNYIIHLRENENHKYVNAYSELEKLAGIIEKEKQSKKK